MGEKFDALRNDYSNFNSLVSSSNESLAAANKLLEQNPYITPLTIFGESPGDFYNRTVHSGNVGVIGLGAISSYVDNALTLPKLNDTLGEYSYG